MNEFLLRGIDTIFPGTDKELLEHINKLNRPLRIKLGIDPTGTDIHLGHTVLLRKLRMFQDAGHIAVVVLGDFTATIGDPTGKSIVRTRLTKDEVELNLSTYIEQLQLLLDFNTPNRLEIHYNSEWLSSINLSSLLDLLSTSTINQLLAKEDFSLRYKGGNPIYLHEFIYPLLQGYDSVQVRADIEVGGTDQRFNILMGRDIQKQYGHPPQYGLLMSILRGTDGRKMSKSLDNHIGIRDEPYLMYQRLQALPDDLVKEYFHLLTDIEDIPKDPREAQKLLAATVVNQYHGADIGEQEVTLKIEFPIKIIRLLHQLGLANSLSDARRSIEGGAIRIDGDKVTDINLTFTNRVGLEGKSISKGKKRCIVVWIK